MYGNYSMDTLRMMNRVDADIRRRAIYDPRLRNSLSVRQMYKIKERNRKKFKEDVMKW
jgi:hypothetical protein